MWISIIMKVFSCDWNASLNALLVCLVFWLLSSTSSAPNEDLSMQHELHLTYLRSLPARPIKVHWWHYHHSGLLKISSEISLESRSSSWTKDKTKNLLLRLILFHLSETLLFLLSLSLTSPTCRFGANLPPCTPWILTAILFSLQFNVLKLTLGCLVFPFMRLKTFYKPGRGGTCL